MCSASISWSTSIPWSASIPQPASNPLAPHPPPPSMCSASISWSTSIVWSANNPSLYWLSLSSSAPPSISYISLGSANIPGPSSSFSSIPIWARLPPVILCGDISSTVASANSDWDSGSGSDSVFFPPKIPKNPPSILSIDSLGSANMPGPSSSSSLIPIWARLPPSIFFSFSYSAMICSISLSFKGSPPLWFLLLLLLLVWGVFFIGFFLDAVLVLSLLRRFFLTDLVILFLWYTLWPLGHWEPSSTPG